MRVLTLPAIAALLLLAPRVVLGAPPAGAPVLHAPAANAPSTAPVPSKNGAQPPMPGQFPCPTLLGLSHELQMLVGETDPYVVAIRGRALSSVGSRGQQMFHPVPTIGSGFFIDDGYVVTTAEVVQGVANPYVVLANGWQLKADSIAYNLKDNVALLHIHLLFPIPGLPFSKFPPPSAGALVVSIGEQSGFPNSASLGIVAATGRSARSTDGRWHYHHLLQFQGNVGAGSSGSPLIDGTGKVVGMMVGVSSWSLPAPWEADSHGRQPLPPLPTFLASSTTGFALPAALVQAAVEVLRKGRSTTLPAPGWFGLFLSHDHLKAIVQTVFVGGSAYAAGIRPGDRIMMVDNVPVSHPQDVRNASQQLLAGQNVPIVYQRNGKKYAVKLKVLAIPDFSVIRTMKKLELPDHPR